MTKYFSEQAGNAEPKAPYHRSMPFAPVIATMVGIIAWLIFILLFALDWSKSYSLFQNVVVFIVSLCITAMVLGMMWIIWGRNRWDWWT